MASAPASLSSRNIRLVEKIIEAFSNELASASPVLPRIVLYMARFLENDITDDSYLAISSLRDLARQVIKVQSEDNNAAIGILAKLAEKNVYAGLRTEADKYARIQYDIQTLIDHAESYDSKPVLSLFLKFQECQELLTTPGLNYVVYRDLLLASIEYPVQSDFFLSVFLNYAELFTKMTEKDQNIARMLWKAMVTRERTVRHLPESRASRSNPGIERVSKVFDTYTTPFTPDTALFHKMPY
jgi:hypothetical protein